MRRGSNDLQGIHIIQQDAEGNIMKKWYARRARFDPSTTNWSLSAAKP